MSVKGSSHDKRNTQNTVQFRTERKRSASERKGSACLCILLSTGALVSDLQYSSEQNGKGLHQRGRRSACLCILLSTGALVSDLQYSSEQKGKSLQQREEGVQCVCVY